MAEITGLVLPFFGLILLGYIAARITKQPQEAMGWLNTFIIYVSLPALFFKLLSRTPIEQLARWDYVLTSMVVTYTVFALVFAAAILIRRATIGTATVQGLAGAYGNIGYMGPGIAILAFGEPAAVPVALIFCFENIMHFTIAPMMMALSGGDNRGPGALA
ncbi:MAG: AEC family transporter, partial [Parvibaculum sp.]